MDSRRAVALALELARREETRWPKMVADLVASGVPRATAVTVVASVMHANYASAMNANTISAPPSHLDLASLGPPPDATLAPSPLILPLNVHQRTVGDWLGTDDSFHNLVYDPSFEVSAAGVLNGGLVNSVTSVLSSDAYSGTNSVEFTAVSTGATNVDVLFNAFSRRGDPLDYDPRHAVRPYGGIDMKTVAATFKIVSIDPGITVDTVYLGYYAYDADGNRFAHPVIEPALVSSPTTGVWYSGIQDWQGSQFDPPGFVAPCISFSLSGQPFTLVVRVDSVLFSIERGLSLVTPGVYFDGSSAGGVWEGTANASTSAKMIGGRSAQSFTRTVSDSLGTSDSDVRTASYARTTADTLGTSDSAVGGPTYPQLTASDTLGTSDAATRAAALRTRTATDTLGTSDAATPTVTLPRTVGDTLGTSDSVTRVQSSPRTAADTLGTSDAATRTATTRSRTSADSLGTSDSATRVVTYVRTVSDALGPSYLAKLQSLSPTSYYRLNETSGTTATDGNSLVNGTYTGTYTQGAAGLIATQVDNALSLGGSGYVTFGGNYLFNSGDFTWLIWCKPSQLHDGYLIGTGDYASADAPSDILLRASGALQWGIRGVGITASSYVANEVMMLALSASGTTIRGTKDGVQIGSNTSSFTGLKTEFRAGSSGGQSSHFKGIVDEVAVWSGVAVSVANQLSLYNSATSAQGVTDAVLSVSAHPRTTSDSLGTSDAATRAAATRVRTSTDTLGTSDAATRAAATRVRTSTDTLGTSDAATRIQVTSRTASDSLNVSDSATAVFTPGTLVRTASDTLGTSDAATRVIVLPRTAADTLATSDAATRAVAFARTSTDTLGTSDAAARGAVSWVRTATDSLGTSDAATPAAALRIRSASDTLGTSDVATVVTSFVRTTTDALVFTDAAARAADQRIRTATDTLVFTDSAQAIHAQSLIATDALGTTDVATRASYQRARVASDTTIFTDAVTSAAALRVRTASDTLGTSDVTARLLVVARSAADALGTHDTATRAVATWLRTASDTLGTSDVATGFKLTARTTDDSLGTSDAATRTITFSRLASDTLGTSDAAISVAILVPATVTITSGPTRVKISKVVGYDLTTFTWGTDLPFDEYVVGVVPAENSPVASATPIPALHGSINVHGDTGPYSEAPDIETTIEGADLELASAGDGDKIVRVFVRRGATWSGS
jgi:hypothetical protein